MVFHSEQASPLCCSKYALYIIHIQFLLQWMLWIKVQTSRLDSTTNKYFSSFLVLCICVTFMNVLQVPVAILIFFLKNKQTKNSAASKNIYYKITSPF